MTLPPKVSADFPDLIHLWVKLPEAKDERGTPATLVPIAEYPLSEEIRAEVIHLALDSLEELLGDGMPQANTWTLYDGDELEPLLTDDTGHLVARRFEAWLQSR